MHARHAIVLVLCGLGAAPQTACTQRETIERYQVPKQHVLDQILGVESTARRSGPGGPRQATDRMLAAIVPHGSQAWFFKVAGPRDPVADQEDEFLALVKSVRFPGPDGSPPQWILPEGWREEAGSGMRYATFRIGGPEQPLELTVTRLPRGDGDEAALALANINRWRKQMGLPPTTSAQLAQQTLVVQLEGTKATVVNLAGSLRADGMSRPPFASGEVGPPGADPAALAGGPPELSYDIPEGWQEGRVGGLRKAAFEVTDGPQRVEITVIDLDPSAGGLLPNVNRWRAQLEMDMTTPAELEREVRPIQVGRTAGDYVELAGPADAGGRQRILAVIANQGGRAWFFKLMGDADLAQREKQRFEAFVQSVQFATAEGAGDGQ